MRTGEMARAGETPHAAYYGSIDSTPLWLILLGDARLTGDDIARAAGPNALAALGWIDDSGDLDGDGFVEYRRRSKLGLLNQGWKDSGDAIRHLDGRPAEGPIALAEVQGYVYAARRSMARLARHRGETELAARLDTAADALQARFDAAFWLPDARFYAMALDGEKRPVASIASIPARLCGAGSCRTAATRSWPSGCWNLTCFPAGASARSRPVRRATTRWATTPARSGRMTMR
jgi:glycogen debranching enzyme